jgi:NAD(P)-dependent dehydrogenase (short-subunit alcohol dehydrogenase family)
MSDEIRFDGRTVLVTGAGRGLGAAYARALADRGASVVVHDAGVTKDGRDADPTVADSVAAEIVAAGGSAVAAYEDLRGEDACFALVARTLDAFGRIDAIVHNAGLHVLEPLETAEPTWDAVLRTSIDAPFHLTRAAWPALVQQGYGRLVFTTSAHAMHLKPSLAGEAAYAAGKAGAVGLMLAVAAEGAGHGVRANAIAPVAATRISRREIGPGELAAERVAPAVLYLASDRCDLSGVVLGAEDGRFWPLAWQAGADFDSATPEGIAERRDEIEGVALSR